MSLIKILSAWPLFLMSGVIGGVAVLLAFEPLETPEPTPLTVIAGVSTTPTHSFTPTSLPPTPTAPSPLSLTSTPTVGVETLFTPPTSINTATLKPGSAQDTIPSLNPPRSTPPALPTPTPTPIIGMVNAASLNVRWGPGVEYGYAGAVYQGNEVVILGRNGTWLKVETPDQRSGWVAASFIDILPNTGPLAFIPASPIVSSEPGAPVLRTINLSKLNVNDPPRSIFSKLGAFEEHWYTFQEQDPETVLTFMFRPNVNFFGDRFVGINVEFFLYDDNEIPNWPPGNADGLANIGAGEANPDPAQDRDGDLGSGELIWRGGPLVAETRYYFRFVNRTPEELDYCLVPGDVREWVCNQ